MSASQNIAPTVEYMVLVNTQGDELSSPITSLSALRKLASFYDHDSSSSTSAALVSVYLSGLQVKCTLDTDTSLSCFVSLTVGCTMNLLSRSVANGLHIKQNDFKVSSLQFLNIVSGETSSRVEEGDIWQVAQLFFATNKADNIVAYLSSTQEEDCPEMGNALLSSLHDTGAGNNVALFRRSERPDFVAISAPLSWDVVANVLKLREENVDIAYISCESENGSVLGSNLTNEASFLSYHNEMREFYSTLRYVVVTKDDASRFVEKIIFFKVLLSPEMPPVKLSAKDGSSWDELSALVASQNLDSSQQGSLWMESMRLLTSAGLVDDTCSVIHTSSKFWDHVKLYAEVHGGAEALFSVCFEESIDISSVANLKYGSTILDDNKNESTSVEIYKAQPVADQLRYSIRFALTSDCCDNDVKPVLLSPDFMWADIAAALFFSFGLNMDVNTLKYVVLFDDERDELSGPLQTPLKFWKSYKNKYCDLPQAFFVLYLKESTGDCSTMINNHSSPPSSSDGVFNTDAKLRSAVRDEETEYFTACKDGNQGAIQHLINMGYRLLDFKQEDGRTGFHLASKNGHMGVLRLLLDTYVYTDVDEEDCEGMTPLHDACANGNCDIAFVLVQEYKASLTKANCMGLTALHYICMAGLDKLASLIDKENANMSTPTGLSLLHCACYRGYISIIHRLIESEANFDCFDLNGMSPLHCAVSNNFDDAVELLVSVGADVVTPNNSGVSPIMTACGLGNYDCVCLLAADSSTHQHLSCTDNNGNNALHYACNSKQCDEIQLLVEWLVQLGVRADIQNKEGKNAIQYCHLRRRANVASWLSHSMIRLSDDDLKPLEKLSCTLKKRDNYTVFSMNDESEVDERSTDGSSIGVVEDLLLYLWRFCAEGNVNAVKFIFDINGDFVKRRDSCGKAAIHIASEYGHFQLVQWLVIEGNICVDTFDEMSNTPLYIACSCNHIDLALWLLRHGAEPTSLNVDGVAPLEVLCTTGNHEIFSAVISLIEDFQPNMMFSQQRTILHMAVVLESPTLFDIVINIPGINVNALDNEKRSPLHLACNCGYSLRATELVNRGAVITALDSHDNTPLHCACRGNSHQTFEYLMSVPESKYILLHCNKDKDTCLHLAAFYGNVYLVKAVLSHNLDTKTLNANGFSALECACSSIHGSVDMAKFLVKQGCNPVRRNEIDGSTTLHLASRHGHIGLTIWLIKKYADIVDSVDRFGYTPFLRACEFGHLRVMKLLYNTEEVNVFTLTAEKQYSALFLACAGNHIAASSWLVTIGLNPYSPNAEGISPIEVAELSGSKEVAQNLQLQLDKKQLHGHRDEYFRSSMSIILEESLRSGNDWEYCNQVLESILQSDSSHVEFPHGKQLIHYAAACGNISVMESLLSRGVDPNATTADGRTPLFYAAARGHLEVVAFIYKNGGDVYIKDMHGNSILDMAIRYQHDAIISWVDDVTRGLEDYREQILVRNEDKKQSIFACFSDESRNNNKIRLKADGDLFDFDAVDKSVDHSFPPLDDFEGVDDDVDCYENVVLMRKACVNGELGTIEKYVEGGISLNGLNDEEYTFLHHAVSGGNLGAVTFLLEHGANPNICDERGNTPLHEACQREFVDIAVILVRFGALLTEINSSGQTAFHIGASLGTLDLFSRIIDLPRSVLPELDLCTLDSHGCNLMHTAALNGHTSLLIFFVSLDVFDINQRDTCGKTALHYACGQNSSDTVLFLIKHSVSMDITDDKGYTPLMYAIATGNYNISKWLVQQGASLFTKSLSGNTALHIACSGGDLLMVKWLVECGLKSDTVNASDLSPMEYAVFKGYTDIVSYLTSLNHGVRHLLTNDVAKELIEVDIYSQDST
jgi:ankyrin repeat protein